MTIKAIAEGVIGNYLQMDTDHKGTPQHTPPYVPEPGHFLFTSESVGEGHPGTQEVF